ncbi:MAG: CBS domain-containing protein [Candidatus Hermodarchaeota archaeon]|jgi:CBS domain-containing protein|nr:CBS domain-containing protein [Candidatus Hermodarchaeota archaeon]
MHSSKHVIDVARRKVLSGHPDDPLSTIAKSMVDHWISSIVIEERGKPVGIVTDGIIFRLIAKKQNPLLLSAKDVMAHPVHTIPEDASLEDAEAAFHKSKVSRLVVVDDKGQVTGIVSHKDIDRFGAYSLAEKLLHHRHEALD